VLKIIKRVQTVLISGNPRGVIGSPQVIMQFSVRLPE